MLAVVEGRIVSGLARGAEDLRYSVPHAHGARVYPPETARRRTALLAWLHNRDVEMGRKSQVSLEFERAYRALRKSSSTVHNALPFVAALADTFPVLGAGRLLRRSEI